MKSIFIVLGVTGEEEQQRSWLVKAFPSEQDALSFIDRLEATYESFADEEDIDDELIETMKKFDENFEFDPETGTEYSVTELPFEGSARPPSRPNERSTSRDQRPSRGGNSKPNSRRPQRK